MRIIDLADFAAWLGVDPVAQAPGAVARWRKSGDLACDDARLWITAQGLRWSTPLLPTCWIERDGWP